VGGNSSTATTRKGIRAHGAAHMADVRNGARATGAWPSSYHVHEASDRAPFKRRRDWQVGPDPFLIFLKIFKHSNIDIRIGVLLDVQISATL
jgi:hypothetical protein